jgi:hypothetical protein
MWVLHVTCSENTGAAYTLFEVWILKTCTVSSLCGLEYSDEMLCAL